MRRASLLFGVAFALLLPGALLACKCMVTYPVCDEVATSDFVFIGTVESIEPSFLNRSNLSSSKSVQALNAAYLNAEGRRTDASLAELKAAYLRIFPELPKEEQDAAKAVKSTGEVSSAFYELLNRGMRVRFRVRTFFKQGEDDDDTDKKDDDDDQVIDVWNPFGDCGIDFQTGETYLVYANSEESTDYIFTGSCTRTRRMSDAGGDLAYLFFYKNRREQSARLEGFTTADVHSQASFDLLDGRKDPVAPVPDALIELRGGDLRRYAQTDAKGQFVFDGLPKGDYRLSAYSAGYPAFGSLLAGPQQFEIQEKGCARQILVLPPGSGKEN